MRNKRKFLMVGFVIAFAALVGVASIAAQPATSYGFPSTLRHFGTPTSSSEQATTEAGAQGGAGSGNVQALASTSFGVAQDGGLGQALPQSSQVALGTGFTYQGQLKKSGTPINDNNCSMTFSLWDSQSNGTGQVGGNQTINPVVVTNGLFSVLLNGAGQFGASGFNGEARWLQTSVKCAGDGSPITLSRQPLTAAPYALFSAAPWATSGSTLYYNGGNVGIGTTNPATLLHLNSPNTLLRLESTQNDVWTVTDYKTDTREWHTGVGGSNVPNDVKNKYYIYDATANQVRMVIKTDGSVGIGMTIPFATLDVQGPDTNGGTLAFQVSNSNADFGLQVYDDRSVRIGALNSSTTTHACYSNPFIHAFAACSSAAEYVPTMNDGSGFPETADLVSLAPAVTNPYGDTHGPFAV